MTTVTANATKAVANWESIVSVAGHEAAKLLVKGPVEPRPLMDSLLLLLSRSEVEAVLSERKALGYCADPFCRRPHSGETAVEIEVGDEPTKAKCCSEECAGRVIDLIASSPISNLPYDDPGVVHTVTALFPKLNVAALLQGSVLTPTGETVVPGADLEKGAASAVGGAGMVVSERKGDKLKSIPNQEVGLEEGEAAEAGGEKKKKVSVATPRRKLPLGDDMTAYLEAQLQGAFGLRGSNVAAGSAGLGRKTRSSEVTDSMGQGRGSSTRPQQQALKDFSMMITDTTRERVVQSGLNHKLLFRKIPALREAIDGTMEQQKEWPSIVGVQSFVSEASGQRLGVLGQNVRSKFNDFTLLLRLPESSAMLLRNIVLEELLPTFQFPEPITCCSPAAWTCMCTLLIVLASLASPAAGDILEDKKRVPEVVEVLQALGMDRDYLIRALCYL